MPRYMVERTFKDGLNVPAHAGGAAGCSRIVDVNSGAGVTWIHSYVSTDKSKTFCIYDGPTPESILKVAERNGLPVDRISEVRVLDPYFNY